MLGFFGGIKGAIDKSKEHMLSSDDKSVDYGRHTDDVVPTVPDEEKKYYQPDSYYSMYAFENTSFEVRVITFNERKKISFPSKRGLSRGDGVFGSFSVA